MSTTRPVRTININASLPKGYSEATARAAVQENLGKSLEEVIETLIEDSLVEEGRGKR